MIKLKQILLEGKGDCYQAGGRLIMSYFGKDAKLVHGMVSGQGQLEGVRFGHCWVEVGDKVLDHSNDREQELPKDIYYLLGRIDPKECHYYTPEEASKKMVDTGHFGPWDMTGLTVKDTYGDLGPEEYKELVLGEVNTKDVIPDQRMEIGKHDLRITPTELDNIEDKLVMGEAGRIPRKKGQKRNSKKHSDLYTDENPKGTIHGLKFATVKDAKASVRKIKSSGRKHAHKVQAAVAMEQRAKAAGKKSAAAVYRRYINSVKKSEADLHSKLSRGHKPDYYQLHTPEFKPFDKSRDDIEENITQNLIDAWKKETSDSEIKMFCKRDGCGPGALDFKNFAKERGIELKRIEGFFHADKVASEKKDFTPEMKDEFLDQGGNFNNAKEREEWVENSKYSDQWKFIPHYWLEDDKGTIYDPVGQEQFIDMGFAKDLNKERYTLTDEVNENFADGKKPGRKGISKRVGIPEKPTLTQLAKLAKSKGEKGRMARWQLNMRRGKKKKK